MLMSEYSDEYEDPFNSSGDEFAIAKLEKMELDVSEDDDTVGSLFDTDSFADFDLSLIHI